eukprot:8240081-Pyramimonas_sp.AAC.1
MIAWTRSLVEGVGARCTPIIGVDLNDRLGHSSEDRCEGGLTSGYDPQTEEEDQAVGILAAEEEGLAARLWHQCLRDLHLMAVNAFHPAGGAYFAAGGYCSRIDFVQIPQGLRPYV